MDNPYALAAALAQNGNYDLAWKIVGGLLNDNPNDPMALVCASYVMLHTGALPQAYHFAKSATEILPNDDGAWLNFGHAASRMCLLGEAEKYYRQALRYVKTAANRNSIWTNLAALYVDKGEWEKAEKFSRRLLDVDPYNKSALGNLGFCQLAKQEWAEGWRNFHNTVGSNWRKKVRYKEEPEWDGSPGKTVVIYADQGIGDEISFASMIPDAAKLCKKLILDCDGRLEGLFRRSFAHLPNVKVYGTRVKEVKWDKEDRNIDASLSIGQLGEFVRTNATGFTGAPYLKACPTRVAQWKSHFSTLKKPVIGIAWTGGVPHTNARNRKISLEDLLPVFDFGLDAHFVCLQYKDAADEIKAFNARNSEPMPIDLMQYPWATLTNDYDDTAAIIAACDHVLCIQTAAARTAGALGVPCTVLLPIVSNWFYAGDGDKVLWHDSLRLVRQKDSGDWQREITLVAESLAHQFGLSQRAATAARDGDLWHGINPIRAARQRHH